MNKELLDELKEIVLKNYDSEMCGATSEWSQGNYDDVFSDGEACGASCNYCRHEDYEDSELLEFALKMLDISKNDLIEAINCK